MKRRILALLLVLSMVMVWVPSSVFAAETASGTCGDNLTWVLEDGVLTISGTGKCYFWQGPKVIPWYDLKEKITVVILEDGVGSIGDCAFYGCSNLTSIAIPNSVTGIGAHTFYGCSNLTSIAIPNSVTSIGGYAFQECSSLTSITIPNGVSRILEGTFNGCSSLTGITIPDNVTHIASGAFAYCTDLTGIHVGNDNKIYCNDEFGVLYNKDMTTLVSAPGTIKQCIIPDSVASIESMAFGGCSSLINITIPDSVASIESMAFEGCSSLTSITIPDSVTCIGSFAFVGCGSLTDVYYGGSEAQWNQIEIGMKNECLTNATMHYGCVISTSTGYNSETGFNPEKDAWSFRNNYDGFAYDEMGYSKDENPYRISEERYEEVFGKSYVASAKASSDTVFSTMMPEWGGNCYGMCATAVLFYLDMLDWDDYGPENCDTVNSYYDKIKHTSWLSGRKLYTVSNQGEGITGLIESYQILQHGSNEGYKGRESTADELDNKYWTETTDGETTTYQHNPNGGYIKILKNTLLQASEPLAIDIVGGGGAHSLVLRTDQEPRKMDDGIWRFYVYDPNHPYLSEEIIEQKDKEPTSYYSNGTMSYIELNVDENKWRYYGSVNGSYGESYWGCDKNWEVIQKKETEKPNYIYAFALKNSGIPLSFNGKEPWLSRYKNETGFVWSGFWVDIYTNNNILVCSIEDGVPVYLGDGVEFIPYTGVIEDGDNAVCGKITIPYSEFTVECADETELSIIGTENVINVLASGSVTLTGAINDGEIELSSENESDVVVQITDVYSSSEYTSAVAEGTMSEGDTIYLKLDDDQLDSSYSGDGEVDIYTDNDEKPDRQHILALDESDGDVAIEDVRDDEAQIHKHSYGTPKFSWDEKFGCSATFKCGTCGETKTVNCSVSQTTTPATATNSGKTVYTATVEFNGKTYTDTKTVVIDALGCLFTDLANPSSYYDAVLWAVDKGITKGTSDTEFSPKADCTRAQIVTFLWRYAGEPEPTITEHNFVDLVEDSSYYKAVLWAVEMGITNGMDETHFGPKEPCTRAQIVTFLWRAAGKPQPSSQQHSFEDIVEGSSYYDAVLWAVEKGITTGADTTHFNPKDTCTRAQGMTFLWRYNNTK